MKRDFRESVLKAYTYLFLLRTLSQHPPIYLRVPTSGNTYFSIDQYHSPLKDSGVVRILIKTIGLLKIFIAAYDPLK